MKGSVLNSELVKTTLEHVNTKASTLLNCTIKDSDLANLRMHECDVKGNIRFTGSCEMTISPLALRKFPPEIRKKIFEHAIEWHGETPDIIKALGGDQKLYHGAMDV
jgi:hypothetical protein